MLIPLEHRLSIKAMIGQNVDKSDHSSAIAVKPKPRLFRSFLNGRLALSRLALIVAIPIILFTKHSFSEDAMIDYVMEIAGPALIIAGGVGRIWSSLYISGKKNKRLVTTGPYSMLQHPLYFFSGILCLGVAMALENVLIIIVLVPLFVLYYSAIILGEERMLFNDFGAEYEQYRKTTPRFLPAVWKYRRGSQQDGVMMIEERAVGRTVRESVLFLLLIPVAITINLLHHTAILPAITLF